MKSVLALLLLALFSALLATESIAETGIIVISDAAAAADSEQAMDEASVLARTRPAGGISVEGESSSTANESEPAPTEEKGPEFPPAPKLTASDYPRIAGVNGRIAVWLAAQLHLWFAAFVLAVPIFVFIIEAIGMRTRDRRYDEMAYEFIKVSITAYSLTAILGGLLAIFLLLFYPHLYTYLATIFKGSMFYYALLFFVESAVSCICITTAGTGCRAGSKSGCI